MKVFHSFHIIFEMVMVLKRNFGRFSGQHVHHQVIMPSSCLVQQHSLGVYTYQNATKLHLIANILQVLIHGFWLDMLLSRREKSFPLSVLLLSLDFLFSAASGMPILSI